jgi:predicted cytidylate kinase
MPLILPEFSAFLNFTVFLKLCHNIAMAIITIGGNIGAGKTTLAAELSKALGYEELYIGQIFREMAAERNMTIDAFYAELANNAELERSIDARQAKLMREKSDLVIQGRVAWYFAKESQSTAFNIFLAVDPTIGAQRIIEREAFTEKTTHEVAAMILSRETMEQERYKTLYGIEDVFDASHYDFTLDTSHLSREQMFEKIMEKLKGRLEGDL